MRNALLLLTCACIILGCKKESVMPTTPEIALVGVNTQSVVQFADHVKIRFSYKDGDGDLGQSDPDAHTLWVKDARLSNADGYHIPPLAPEGSEVPIQGELEVELNALFLLGNSTQETTTYTVFVEDRAGNRSNEFVTDPITITTDSL